MSSLIVEVKRLDEIKIHPNADRLALAIIGGWQCAVPKDRYKAGDLVVYIPPDTILPGYVSDGLGVTNYLSNGRVRSIKLRGEPSFGLIIDALPDWQIEQNVAAYFGATKYEPPVKAHTGDADTEHIGFPKFTDIENLRHFPDLFERGEPVWVTEKIHGSSCRVGMVNGQLMAGSHHVRRKMPADYHDSVYWLPWLHDGIQSCLETMACQYQQVIIYGEIYGPCIQNLHYGAKTPQFAVFDMKVGGKYVSPQELWTIAERYGFPTVPYLGTFPYSLEMIKALASGKSALADHIREGVVIRPLEERDDPKVGRVIAKYVSDDYLVNQDKYSDYTDLVRQS